MAEHTGTEPPLLGFLEKHDSAETLAGYQHDQLPCLFGGQPLYLPSHGAPNNTSSTTSTTTTTASSPSSVKCTRCGGDTSFLMQFYAPEAHPEHAFHRYIYVYMCTNYQCYPQSSTNAPRDPADPENVEAKRRQLNDPCSSPFVVLRAQMPDIIPDDVFLKRASGEETHKGIVIPEREIVTEDEDVEQARKAVAAAKLAMRSAKKGKSSEEDEEEDDEDEEEEDDVDLEEQEKLIKQALKRTDDAADAADAASGLATPAEEEPTEETTPTTQTQKKQAPTHSAKEDAAQLRAALSKDTTLKDTEIDVDPEFIYFQQRMSIEPHQVVRYQRSPLTGEQTVPLWCSAIGVVDPKVDSIPRCPHCGGSRSFEFQIMPQTLAFLGTQIDTTSKDRAIDFGTVAIYTCDANCDVEEENGIKKVPYKTEFAYVQNFSAHSMSDGWGLPEKTDAPAA